MTTGMEHLVAAAFGLGTPTGVLEPIRAASNETWRLECADGCFVVKRLGPGAATFRRPELETAMELERRALEAGIATVVPVPPVEPLFGWATEIAAHGVWRAYGWVEHTATDPAHLDPAWFGETLATVHRLYPLAAEADPRWRWLGVHPPATWRRWLAIAAERGRSWSPVAAAQLEGVLAVSNDVRRLYAAPPDRIVGHGDFGPWNVLDTPQGPVLIDWESAGPTTASAELGRAVVAFADDDLDRMRGLVAAYRRSGGTVACGPDDLFVWLITQQLSGLAERIAIDLGDLDEDDDPDPVWMDAASIVQDIVSAFTTLPTRWQELRRRSEHVLQA